MHRAIRALVVVVILLLVALYAGEGRLTGSGSGRPLNCTVNLGPREGEVVPVFVDCLWPVPAEQVQKLLTDWGRHDDYFSNLSVSAVLAANDEVVTVRQVHRATAMRDREVIVEWRTEKLSDGYRYAWRKAADQSSVARDRVEVEQTRGHWEVRADGNRTRLRYEARYLPGGDIPGFLLRLFLASGMKGVIADFRDTVDRTAVAGTPISPH